MIDLEDFQIDFVVSLGLVVDGVKGTPSETIFTNNLDLSRCYRKLQNAVKYGEGDANSLLIIYKKLLTQIADSKGLLKKVEVKEEQPVCYRCAKFQMKKMAGEKVHMRCSAFGEVLNKSALALECNQLIVKDFVT